MRVVIFFILITLIACAKKEDESIPEPQDPNIFYGGDYDSSRFMNRNLSGEIRGSKWNLHAGVAKKNQNIYSIRLYDEQDFLDICNGDINNTGDDIHYVSFNIPDSLGFYQYPAPGLTGPENFKFTTVTGLWSTNSIMSGASFEITRIDTLNNIIEGKLRACVFPIDPQRYSFYVNGNFTADICP